MIPTRACSRVARTAFAWSICCLAFAAVGRAQTPAGAQNAPPAPAGRLAAAELDARAKTLKQWIDNFTRWEQLRDKQRQERNLLQRAREGRQRTLPPKPAPPEWLAADCRDVAVGDTGLWADGCHLLDDWKDDAAAADLRREIVESRAQHEAPTNTKWWQHVHLDALWPMTQAGTSVYGIVGTHAAVEIAGRFQVFVAPGAIVLTMPGAAGSREWKIAADWGVGYRLLDFKVPGTHRNAQLHVNLVTARVLSGASSLLSNTVNLAGFSFTLKKTPAP